MPDPFAVQISELVKSGRVSPAMANALTEHYSKQYDQLKKETGGAPPLVNLMDLMNLIDLLEKKAGVQKISGLPPNPSPQQVHSPRPVAMPLPPLSEGSSAHSEILRMKSEKEKLEVHNEALKKRCEALEAESAAEKKAQKESSTDEFVYAKRFAEAEAERRQARFREEEQRKTLEEENRRLADEIKRLRDAGETSGKGNGEMRAAADISSAQIQSLEQRCAECQAEIERLRDEIRGWESKCAQREAEIKANEAAAMQASEKHRLVLEDRDKDHQVAAEERKRLGEEGEGLKRELARTTEETAGLNARILELEEEGQHSAPGNKVFEEDRARLEGEKLHLEKALENCTADLAAVGQEKEGLTKELEKNNEEKGKALARVLEAEENAVQAAAQTEGLKRRCAELESEISQAKAQGDEKARILEGLTKRIKEMESLLSEKANVQAALEEELKQEKEMHAKDQVHARYLEETLTALEKRIDALISPPGI